MKNFKLSEIDILSNQDWTFPTTTYYGPGRFNEIGKFCEEFEIKNPLIVTDSGSKDLPFINKLETLLSKNNIKSDIFYCNARGKGKPLLISCSPKENIKDLGSKIGDSVYTSGLGGIFIKDTKIGFISDISVDSAGELEVIITLLGNPLEENFYGIIGNLEDEA